MDFDRIERLLAKYWACETTLDEEAELKKFFNGPSVPAHLSGYVSLFQYYEKEHRQGPLDDLFDQQVLDRIAEVKGEGRAKRGKVIKFFFDVSKVAAVVLVLVTAGYFIKQEYTQKKDDVEPYLTDTFEDPRAAFEETKRALQIISANFNKGRKEAKKLGALHEAQQKAKNIDSEL